MNEPITITEALDELFGPEYIVRQCAEECTEEAHALLKLIRADNGEITNVDYGKALTNLIEEIADVQLMTGMVIEILGIELDEIEKWMNKKLIRLRKRLDDYMAADIEGT